MCYATAKKLQIVIFFVAFLLVIFSGLLESKTTNKGNIIGFIYDSDGATALKGAVIQVKNISTGNLYKSTISDRNGIFTLKDVESGLYQYGVISPEGEFMAQDIFGVKINSSETIKMSIALSPYEDKVQDAMQEILPEQKIAGEAYVGRVVEFNQETGIANIYIVKGFLQQKNRIHTKGEKTDFYQNIDKMQAEGKEVKKLFPGQTALVEMNSSCEIGDAVYVVSKRGLVPLFLTPVGTAAIIAASAGVIFKVSTLAKEKVIAVSAFKD